MCSKSNTNNPTVLVSQRQHTHQNMINCIFLFMMCISCYAFEIPIQSMRDIKRNPHAIQFNPKQIKFTQTKRIYSKLKSVQMNSDIVPIYNDMPTSNWNDTLHNHLDQPQHNNIRKKANKVTKKDYFVVGVAAITIIYVSYMLMRISGPGSWRFYTAGAICACVSHTITTPIDVVKTRQQVDPDIKKKGFIKGTVSIIKTDGMKVLLSGLGPTSIGYLFEGAIKFGIYEVLKPSSSSLLKYLSIAWSMPQLHSRFLGYILCGSVSGFFASIILCPMEALRIRLVAEPEFAKLGSLDAGILMCKEEGGIRAVYKGLLAMISKQVPYTVTKQVTFDVILSIAYASWIGLSDLNSQFKFMITLISAIIAGAVSAVGSQPGDTLLSLVNAHEGKKSTTDFAKEIMTREGMKGFFVGMKTRFLHVGIMVTVQLVLYDFLKRLCGLPAVA